MSAVFTVEKLRRKPTLLVREFYNRDPRVVARELLGKVLVRKERGILMAGRIVETEAYLGADDAAAHSAAGRTARNEVLFGPPGYAYVYFIYGMHYCLNVSCLPDGEAGGVLFRALEPIEGVEKMAANRDVVLGDPARISELKKLTSGPGRLAEAFAITRPRDNGVDLTNPRMSLWIGDDGYTPRKTSATARIGITKSIDHLWRYIVADSPFVSGRLVSR